MNFQVGDILIPHPSTLLFNVKSILIKKTYSENYGYNTRIFRVDGQDDDVVFSKLFIDEYFILDPNSKFNNKLNSLLDQE